MLCLWPIFERRDNSEDVPIYKIVGPGLQVAAPDDNDYCVLKQPVEVRFKVGDNVILNADKVFLIPSAQTRKSGPSNPVGWHPGIVEKVDLVGMHTDTYAVYQCSTQFSQDLCVIKDDDEHICAADAKARDRLLEAIDQDCSYHHIGFLVETYDMDVLPIRDMLFKRAMDQGSFGALRWLEDNAGMPMSKPRFENGNTILHEIAASPTALRFLRGYQKYSQPGAKDTSLTQYNHNASGPEKACFHVTNDAGDTWLVVLLKSNTFKAIDFALSIEDGLFGSELTDVRWMRDLSKLSSVVDNQPLKSS